VVVNFGDIPESVEVNLDNLDGEVIVATPFHPDSKIVLPAPISIPPRQIAVVVKP
jgi:hypothetical protein